MCVCVCVCVCGRACACVYVYKLVLTACTSVFQVATFQVQRSEAIASGYSLQKISKSLKLVLVLSVIEQTTGSYITPWYISC